MQHIKFNKDNVQVIQKYKRWMIEAKGYSSKTIKKHLQVISYYEEYTDHADFKTFNEDSALDFKNNLKKRKYRNKQISLSTVNDYLRYLMNFFQWLHEVPGYKSKIHLFDIDFLNLKRSDKQMAQQHKRKKYPTLQQVKILVDSIDCKTQLDMRDQAFIAFALCSAMRIDAIASMPISSFYPNDLGVDQNPMRGMRLKNSKAILTWLFPFDDDLTNIIIDWHRYLLNEGFGYDDPMFPAAKVERLDGLSFSNSIKLSKNFIGQEQLRNIMRKRCYNANMDYFNPHSFRHAAIAIALRNMVSIEQLKAVSQNVSHKAILTSLEYGMLTEEQVKSNIRALNKPILHMDDKKSFEEFKEFKKYMKMKETITNGGSTNG